MSSHSQQNFNQPLPSTQDPSQGLNESEYKKLSVYEDSKSISRVQQISVHCQFKSCNDQCTIDKR